MWKMPFKEASAQCIALKGKTLKSLEENLSLQLSFATQATALKTFGTLVKESTSIPVEFIAGDKVA
jgi:hypothetical protein